MEITDGKGSAEALQGLQVLRSLEYRTAGNLHAREYSGRRSRPWRTADMRGHALAEVRAGSQMVRAEGQSGGLAMGKRRREPYPDTPDLARADIIALALDRCPTGIRNPLR